MDPMSTGIMKMEANQLFLEDENPNFKPDRKPERYRMRNI